MRRAFPAATETLKVIALIGCNTVTSECASEKGVLLFEPYSASVTGMLRATASRNALSVKGSHARVARESALTGVKYIRNTFVTVTELSVTRMYSVTL